MKEMNQNSLFPARGFFAAPDSTAGGSSPSDQVHTVTIAVDTTYGKFTASPQSAEAGTQVTLTAEPGTDYMFLASGMKITGDSSGNRIFTDPSVPTAGVYTFIMPDEDVTVTGEFFQPDGSIKYVTNTNDSGTDSLRQAIEDVPNGGTVQINLPALSVIALDTTISGIKKSLTIEGNGAILTRSAAWVPDANSLLRNGVSDTVLTVRRLHFKNGESSGNGTAIRWDAMLTLESCIFSGNVNTGSGLGGAAVYKAEGNAVISGCTFYNNIANIAAAVGIGGGHITFTLIGNLFYGNGDGTLANDHYPILGPRYLPDINVDPSYNVIDVGFGLEKNECGWEQGTGDTTFAVLGIAGIPFDTTTFVPVSDLKIMPQDPVPGFPATDFYGEQRVLGGAPGAVNAA